MADTRTLKLSLLADVKKFTDGMNDADNSTKTLNDKVGKYSKKMAAAFLGVATAIGIMAGKMAIDSVKAAADDELSQTKLRDAILKVKGTTDDTVTSTEKWIEKMQFTKGFADNELRPALADLARYTGDIDTAQRLLNDAMDIAAAKGVPLETVAKGIGKAYNGQYTALNKLGVPLDAAKTKSGDFEGIMRDLNKQFAGAAISNADTYAGKINILQQRFGELQESAGQKLIDKLITIVDMTGKVAQGFSGEDPNSGLSGKVKALSNELNGGNKGSAYNLGASLKSVADAFGTLFGALAGSKSTKSTDNLQKFADALNAVASGINAIATAYTKAKDFFDKYKAFDQAFSDLLTGKKNVTDYLPGRATGGPVAAGGSYLVGERGPEILQMGSRGGNIIPNGGMGGGTVINLNGIVDAESARRSIEQLIQRSARRTGAIDWVGATL